MTGDSGEVKDGPPPGENPVAKRPPTFKDFLLSDQARAAIMPMLPEGQTYERVVRECLNALADNPSIGDSEPGSIIRAVSRAVSWDLEIGVTAFLVPRKDKKADRQPKLRAQIGYRGKIVLMTRPRGTARLVDAQCFYANEHFRHEQGTNPFIEHRPIIDPKKRGELVGAYAYAKMSAYESKIEVMHRDEVEEIRQLFSQQWKTKWVNGQQVPLGLEEIPWYCEARCVHRLAKQVPMPSRVRAILAESDGVPEEEEELEARRPAALGEGPFDEEAFRASTREPVREEVR